MREPKKLRQAARTASPAKIAAVHEVVDKGLVSVVFQPILDQKSGTIYAYEALARCLSPHFNGPVDLYETATLAGRVGELGRLHRTQAVKNCPDWPLFLNVFPNEFDYGLLVRPDDPMFRHRHQIHLEITESAPISHFEQCHSVLGEIRKKGILLAIDDLGAGYSNLKYIADLEPAVVKLDRELVSDVKHGSRQAKLLASIVALSHGMGAEVVAEGIATDDEFGAANGAGVDYFQGFLFAHPAYPPPPAEWPTHLVDIEDEAAMAVSPPDSFA